MTLLFNAVFLSLDTLVASVALSPLFKSPGQRWCLAVLFGICDGLAVIAGFSFGGLGRWGVVMHQAGPMFTFCCGLYCLAAAFRKKFRADRRLAFFLPVLMSLDNFAYGIRLGPSIGDVVEDAAILGVTSFSLAMLGLLIANFIHLPKLSSERAAGLGLVTASLLFCLV